MLEIPDAEPTCSSGTALVAAAEQGPLDRAIPAATATMGRTNAAYAHEESVGIRKAKPTVMITNPSRTATRVPIRAAIFGTSGARTTKPTVAGIVARPASSGVIP